MKLITNDDDHYKMYLKFWICSSSKTTYIFHNDSYYILFQIASQFSSEKCKLISNQISWCNFLDESQVTEKNWLLSFYSCLGKIPCSVCKLKLMNSITMQSKQSQNKIVALYFIRGFVIYLRCILRIISKWTNNKRINIYGI